MPWHKIDPHTREVTEADIIVGKVVLALCFVLVCIVVSVLVCRRLAKPTQKKNEKHFH